MTIPFSWKTSRGIRAWDWLTMFSSLIKTNISGFIYTSFLRISLLKPEFIYNLATSTWSLIIIVFRVLQKSIKIIKAIVYQLRMQLKPGWGYDHIHKWWITLHKDQHKCLNRSWTKRDHWWYKTDLSKSSLNLIDHEFISFLHLMIIKPQIYHSDFTNPLPFSCDNPTCKNLRISSSSYSLPSIW